MCYSSDWEGGVLKRTYACGERTAKYYNGLVQYYKVLLQYYSVLQSATPPYCKVLLQYYPVLPSTTPVLVCFTKYYNILLQYYKVLFQYYCLLQCTTPVLPLYYKIQLQYFSVLQSSTHDWSLKHMKRHFQCAEQQASSSNFTKYCACHEKWVSGLILLTYETSFTMREATKGSLQLHQILPLPQKMSFRIDPAHIWNVIYHARSNGTHPLTSPNIAPATQNDTHVWSCSHMKRHLQCAEQQHSPFNLTKYCACHAKWHSKIGRKSTENGWSVICNALPTMIPAWCEHEIAKLNPPVRGAYFPPLGNAFCI